MALPQTSNANDISNVIATLAGRQGNRPKTPPLSGPKRAAILMLALGEQYGAKVWQQLDDDEVRELSIVMSTLGTVEADVVEDLLLEFVSRMSASGALMGTFEGTERLLQQYLPPERVTGIMDEIRGPAGRNMWEKLSNVQEEVLANYLKNEYPQTIAVVLSKLKPEHAARVLAILPEDMALDVVGRMLRMEAVQKEVIERVEQTLRVEFMSNLSQTRRRDAHEVMAEIFNNFDRQTETRFITSLEEENRESAERIKALMFTFDDLVKLDAGSAQRRQGQARHRAEERQRGGSRLLPRQHVVARRQDAARRYGGTRPGTAARRRRGTGAAGQSRQGPRCQGRNHADEEPRRRRAGVLMAAPAKFLFDMDFGAPDKTRERPATTAEIAQKIAAAEARAYRDGYDAAQREAKVESDRRAALALEEIGIAIKGIASRFSGIETRMETEAVDVAVSVARKLCSDLIAAEPLGEITGLVRECFSHLVSTPHLVVRINEALYEAARARIEQLAKRSGFEGRLVILAEPEIATGDCRIEWADGGVVLERAAIETKINELVGRYMASRGQAGGTAMRMQP
jgi:flagellar motor switch protein FliG